jgi:N-acetyltransferase
VEKENELYSFAPPGILTGPSLALVPLNETHREALKAAAQLDENIWTYFPRTFNGAGDDFDPWFSRSLKLQENGEHYPFAVIQHADGRILGTTRFYDMAAIHNRLAIGSTWYVPDARGTLINAEVRWLCLSQAFEKWQVNRVELITDPRNLASLAAMKLLGAVQEGVIRSHLVYKDGRVRHSVLFSILREEWPRVRQRLISTMGSKLTEFAKASAKFDGSWFDQPD